MDGEKKKTTSGVQELIDRLRADGVEAGQSQAAVIVAEANDIAKAMLDKARAEAEAILAKARTEADQVRRAAEEDIQLALRDAILGLKERIGGQFQAQVQKLVGEQIHNPEFLRRLILEIAGRAVEEAGGVGAGAEIILPKDIVGIDELCRHPGDVMTDRLNHIVLEISAVMLREGIELRASGRQARGIVLKLAESGLALDLTDEGVAGFLMEHLRPRFRALLEGVVQ